MLTSPDFKELLNLMENTLGEEKEDSGRQLTSGRDIWENMSNSLSNR